MERRTVRDRLRDRDPSGWDLYALSVRALWQHEGLGDAWYVSFLVGLLMMSLIYIPVRRLRTRLNGSRRSLTWPVHPTARHLRPVTPPRRG